MEVTVLQKSHDRRNFECEEQLLTQYLKTQVSQDIKKNLAVCFVATDSDNKVVGYYTLSTESLGREQIPTRYLKKVPKNYNAPVILLGRLARDLSHKGTGLGEHLLLDALYRAFSLSENSIGAMAVIVDPINQHAVEFYRKYGFEQLPFSEKMFLPMNIIRQLM